MCHASLCGNSRVIVRADVHSLWELPSQIQKFPKESRPLILFTTTRISASKIHPWVGLRLCAWGCPSRALVANRHAGFSVVPGAQPMIVTFAAHMLPIVSGRKER